MRFFFRRKQKTPENPSVPVELPVSISSTSASEPIRELTGDISVADMFVGTLFPLEPGTEVGFIIGHGELAVRGAGRVVSSRPQEEGPDQPAGMLIAFGQLEGDGRELLQQIVDGYLETAGEEAIESGELPAAELELLPPDAPDDTRPLRRRVWVVAALGAAVIVAVGLLLGPRILKGWLGPGGEESPEPGTAARLAAEAVQAAAPGVVSRPPATSGGVEGAAPEPARSTDLDGETAPARPEVLLAPGAAAAADEGEGVAVEPSNDPDEAAASSPPPGSGTVPAGGRERSQELGSQSLQGTVGARQQGPAGALGEKGTTFNRLTNVRWQQRGEGLEVVLEGNGPISDYFRLRLEEGRVREVIQLRGASRPYHDAVLQVGSPELSRIRTGFHPEADGNELHVVLDLTGADVRLVRIEGEGNRLHLELSKGSD